jgi:GNAT superfamily N-acetyltransferase
MPTPAPCRGVPPRRLERARVPLMGAPILNPPSPLQGCKRLAPRLRQVSEIRLRPGTVEDAKALVRLSLESSSYYSRLAPEFFAPGEQEGFDEWIAAEWDDGPNTLALVAEIEGDVAGYLEATIQEPPEWGRFFGSRDLHVRRLFINAVLTSEAYRRRGVATRLVEAAGDWGRERGATVALLDTFYDSPVSVPFWERRMGYRRRAIIFRKPL